MSPLSVSRLDCVLYPLLVSGLSCVVLYPLSVKAGLCAISTVDQWAEVCCTIVTYYSN